MPSIRPFHFLRMWTLHESFQLVVKKVWEGMCSTNPMVNVQLKLKKTKQLLKVWNKEVFGNIFHHIKETQSAAFDIPKDGAPGPDGFSSSFFIECWPTVGEDIHKAACSMFSREAIPRAFTASLICLIPKSSEASKFANYHPISLCNVIYKIFSKILASRLSKVLPKLISLEQGAFVKGRAITENIVMALEAMQNLDRKTRGVNIILKLDLEKAYDRIDWNFLKQVLLKFGFRDRWVALMETCWAEAFSRSFRQLVVRGWCKPFSPPRGCPLISHLLFADDTLLFVNGSRESLNTVKEFLSSFQNVSSHRINNTKCYFVPSKDLSATRIRSTERILGFSKARSRVFVPSWEINPHQACLGKYSPPYHGSHEDASPGDNNMEYNFAQFFWGWAEGKRKCHWIAWSKIARPIEEGGLGVRNLKDVLSTLHMKMAWNVKYGDKEGPWVAHMRTIYRGDLEDALAIRTSNHAPPYWKEIRNVLPIIARNAQ
ncbi:uncharacterized protein LOC131244264 [Magnolia sinica]|uniref:uncharacterized protein LOC131244264 n=1 Tax=Magnolia sinica TaxID=86752 RepID=UPI0026596367|nr:uncharacterized protein LOC131244264 [Magnolia sinica]